jgi:hypothetical protein
MAAPPLNTESSIAATESLSWIFQFCRFREAIATSLESPFPHPPPARSLCQRNWLASRSIVAECRRFVFPALIPLDCGREKVYCRAVP